jgi:glycosyltransferase involved in cell wall biosynthesis
MPFVSVVTPVYNGEKYISECIESVLEQTYTHWEYIILNNCSDDNTLQIAEKYATGDNRIKLITNAQFLEQMPNWNEALLQISPESKYCKVVHADDWLTPECLEKMVERAEEYPTAGIVSAYRFKGSRVSGLRGNGLSYDTVFMTGKEAGRRVMKTPLFLFGSPSTILYRADLVRKKDPFYDPALFHADTDVCFDILQESDFAFVHQILSCTRLHDEAASTFADRFHTYILHDLYALKKYGRYYLTPQEYDETLTRTLADHHRWLAKLLFRGHGKETWRYHKAKLAEMNMNIQYVEMSKALALEAAKIKPIAKWMLAHLQSLSSSMKGGEEGRAN